jgi:hypothetical protein
MVSYAKGSLYFLPSILDSVASPGLQEGTLYDVLDKDVATAGNATLSATGFNVRCAYPEEVPALHFDDTLGAWKTLPPPGPTASSYQRYDIYPTRKIPICKRFQM